MKNYKIRALATTRAATAAKVEETLQRAESMRIIGFWVFSKVHTGVHTPSSLDSTMVTVFKADRSEDTCTINIFNQFYKGCGLPLWRGSVTRPQHSFYGTDISVAKENAHRIYRKTGNYLVDK